MKNILIHMLLTVSILGISLQQSFSQEDECGTVITEDQFKERLNLRKSNDRYNNKKALTNAAVRFHIVNKNNGTGGIGNPNVVITPILNRLNVLFGTVGFQFVACNTNVINNTTYYNGNKLDEMTNRYNSANAVDVYFIENANSSASLPRNGSDRVIIRNSSANNESTLAHEMGHYFGLDHTHGTLTPSAYERVRRSAPPNDPCEPNWATWGDGFRDTPADIHPDMVTAAGSAAGSLKSYMNDESHSTDPCTFTGFPDQDVCGDDYMPDVKNIMSYAYIPCRDIFSADQIAEMQAVRQDVANGRGYITSNCSSVVSPNCSDGVENAGESGPDCGGSCDPCPGSPGTVYLDCESGCSNNLILVCGAVSAEEYNGTIVISNAQVTNQNTFTMYDVEIQYSAVSESGAETILIPLFSSSSFIDEIAPNQTVTAPAPIIYTPSELSGLYRIRVHLVGTSNRCLSSEYLAINYFPPVYPTCWDGIQNQGEIGIDCGGPCPVACPTCTDEIKNQGETGIDCGGPCPSACPSCNDGIQNQGEDEVDCGGPCDPCDTCPENLNLSTISQADIYKANNRVSGNGPITINSGAVIFNGGRKVDLLPGFIADASDGYVFEADIKDCSPNLKQSETDLKEVVNDIPAQTTDQDLTDQPATIDIADQALIKNRSTGFDISNYPNPFNTETIIELSLHTSDLVSIYVNDIHGKLISTIKKQEFLSEGNYQFSFDGSTYQAGIYYYSVIVGDQQKTGKMIMLK